MTLSPLDQETIRAIVREEIALDEMRRIEQANPHACPMCGCPGERMGAGVPPTVPVPSSPTSSGFADLHAGLMACALDDDMDGQDWGHLAMPAEGA